jgi:hypothetical protein
MAIMNSPWRPWLATYPILQTWTGAGWPEVVELLTAEAWQAVGARATRPLSDAAQGDTRGDPPPPEADEAVLAGVRFGALLGFALARTYPSSSDELDAWLERAIDYVGESLSGRYAPEDDPTPA